MTRSVPNTATSQRWVILLTDRRRCGAIVRAVPKGYLNQKTTMVLRRAQTFATEREARAALRALPRDRRFRYTITTLT